MAEEREKRLMLVARTPCFGLPTACPDCLPVYFYLKFAGVSFDLTFQNTFPDSEQIPYVESGDYVAYNNEKDGVIECLKEDGIVNLDSSYQTIPEWISTKAMIQSWLMDALLYEVWLGKDAKVAQKIYFSDLPWPIGKVLFFKKVHDVKQLLRITKQNADRREAEIYGRAYIAYKALSSLLGEELYLYGDRPTSLDAVFLGHALFILQALPETSTLRSSLLSHSNLVKYTEKHSAELVEADSLSTVPLHKSDPSSSSSKQGGFSNWSSKPKKKPKKERSEEEKKFRRRAKYFLGAQLIAVLIFLSLLGGSDEAEIDLDEEDESFEFSD